MSRWVRILLIVGLFVLLMLVRAYGSFLFYDPFIAYFRHDYLIAPIPEYDTLKLFLSLFLRYTLNTVISLLIIYLAFQRLKLLVSTQVVPPIHCEKLMRVRPQGCSWIPLMLVGRMGQG